MGRTRADPLAAMGPLTSNQTAGAVAPSRSDRRSISTTRFARLPGSAWHGPRRNRRSCGALPPAALALNAGWTGAFAGTCGPAAARHSTAPFPPLLRPARRRPLFDLPGRKTPPHFCGGVLDLVAGPDCTETSKFSASSRLYGDNSASRRYCSLMGQGRRLGYERCRRFRVPAFSARSGGT